MSNIRIELDYSNTRKGDTTCPHCGSTSVTKEVNGNIWVLFEKGTQILHNCTKAENPWSNYE